MTFADLPIGAKFIDSGYETCLKVSETTARDSWCAPYYVVEIPADEEVELCNA